MGITQFKGDVALARAIFLFTDMGYTLSLPITESAEYDLIVDDSQGLHRVQVKSCSTASVDLRKIHSNSSGYVVKTYSTNSYDWLYVYNPVLKMDYLSREFITTKSKALSSLERIGG